jgi:hypothetical protein
MKEERMNQLDLQIDRALASYTPPSARPGLNERILASVDSDARRRSSPRILAWVLTPVAIAFLLWLIPFWRSRPARPVQSVAVSLPAKRIAIPEQLEAAPPARQRPRKAAFLPHSPSSESQLQVRPADQLAEAEFSGSEIAMQPINIAPIRIKALR